MAKKDLKEVIENKNKTITGLNEYLDNCIIQDEKHMKKANLLSYWLKDYISYLKEEEKFNSYKLNEYKRGDIIKVNLGFNVGNEEGGLHYCVVLDKKNAKSYSTLTVIPLSTQKSTSKREKTIVNLGDDIYKNLEKKSKKMLEELSTNISCEKIEMRELDNKFTTNTDDERIIKDFKKQEIKNKIKEYESKLKQIEKVDNNIARMKKGTIALVNQITTISKQRIYDPKNDNDILAGISLSKEKMDLIDEKIKKLYIN